MDRREWEPHPIRLECPKCGAAIGEDCRFASGQPRNTPHPERR